MFGRVIQGDGTYQAMLCARMHDSPIPATGVGVRVEI